MNFIKLILAIAGIFFLGIVALWLLGMLSSVIWYAFWVAVIGGAIYGGYRLFTKVESRVIGGDNYSNIGDGLDIKMSWDDYDKKYLHK